MILRLYNKFTREIGGIVKLVRETSERRTDETVRSLCVPPLFFFFGVKWQGQHCLYVLSGWKWNKCENEWLNDFYVWVQNSSPSFYISRILYKNYFNFPLLPFPPPDYYQFHLVLKSSAEPLYFPSGMVILFENLSQTGTVILMIISNTVV